MRFEHVCLEAIACTLPEEVVSSAEIEQRLAPLYQRLRLPEGRLELMTGIVERRFWSPGTMPGEVSAATAEKALRQAGIERNRIGALVHGSVCRDYLEPATACGVHRRLGLPAECMVYDVSNACLGLLNGIVQVANMIELGQIEAGLVVGTESSRTLVESTIDRLNRDLSLKRDDVKTALASLTLGSGSAAIVLAHSRLASTGTRLLGGIAQANTAFSDLCRSDRDETIGGDSRPLMWTDSESLLREGVCTAKMAFARFLDSLGWQRHHIARTFCHQVGRAHQRALFAALGLDASIDYSTIGFLGNTGSVALPMTAALGLQSGCVRSGDRVALLGIGSGINVLMLGVEWGCVSQGIR
jgi:3-oxoacyl-[acyl-carrier-protein] synthase-3